MAKQKLRQRGAAVIVLVVLLALVGGSSGATATAMFDDQGLVASWAEE